MPSITTRRPPFRRRGQNVLPLGPHVSLRASVTGTGGVTLGSDASTTFEHKQVPSNIVIEVDWDNDGDFDEPEEDITSLVLSGTCKTGRDWPSQLTGKAGPGALRLTLRNDDDRFSYFNASSPLNTDPFSLKTGRKARVRVAEAGNPDPVLLARDRFERAGGSLVATENGLTWTDQTTAVFQVSDNAALTVPEIDGTGVVVNEIAIATINLGTDTFYAQMSSPHKDGTNTVGMVYRYVDTDNYGMVIWQGLGSSTEIAHYERVAGVSTETFSTGQIEFQEDTTFGFLLEDDQVTIYLNGVPYETGDAFTGASTLMGIRGNGGENRWPIVDNFYVWSNVYAEEEGILWTGDISDLTVRVDPGPEKFAELRGEGWLAKLASTDITPPTSVGKTINSFSIGQTTGVLTGKTLALAQMLHPPGPIQMGEITAGSVGLPKGKALDIARQFEELEFGFLYETAEGPIGFDSRTARDSLYSRVSFSDAAGTQFAYQSITPYDWRREVINQVEAGVSSVLPDYNGASGSFANNAAGVDTDAEVVLPSANDAAPGDLVIAIITPTQGPANGQQWITPHGWVAFNPSQELGKVRIYAKVLTAVDLGATVEFYNDASTGGSYIWEVHRIANWYGSIAGGVAVAEPAVQTGAIARSGFNEYKPLFPPWGKQPTIFIATIAGMTSTSGAAVSFAAGDQPHGYGNFFPGSLVNGSINAYDVAQDSVIYSGNREVEKPSRWNGTFTGFDIVENNLIAIRGFAGVNPDPSGTRTVRVDDLDSQDEHNAVRSHRNPANLFRSNADARRYGNHVLARYADDRPIFAMGFTATKSGAYRNQALRRRVSDRMTLEADNNSGLGIEGDFHIESITHTFSNGVTRWDVLWELSPAVDVNRADTAGSELGLDIDEDDTQIRIDTITGPVWIDSATYPNMFPLTVRIDDEIIRLLSNTSDPDIVSPQFYNVERSVNGVSQSHNAGATVSLADPWIVP